ncbi:alpha-L-rhamnosidase, partial [mine drainage metagenome]
FAGHLENIVTAWLHPMLAKGSWDEIGYHGVVLACRNGLIPAVQRAAAIRFLKAHLMACFPNNAAAPRLSNPGVQSHQLITPYFSYYAFPPLIESGEMDFVLDQYRACWGWALDQGLTTQPEVFDLNWSHCHIWASSPTAQLTQYVLGLQAC